MRAASSSTEATSNGSRYRVIRSSPISAVVGWYVTCGFGMNAGDTAVYASTPNRARQIAAAGSRKWTGLDSSTEEIRLDRKTANMISTRIPPT